MSKIKLFVDRNLPHVWFPFRLVATKMTKWLTARCGQSIFKLALISSTSHHCRLKTFPPTNGTASSAVMGTWGLTWDFKSSRSGLNWVTTKLSLFQVATFPKMIYSTAIFFSGAINFVLRPCKVAKDWGQHIIV